jgi:hypothetical protein
MGSYEYLLRNLRRSLHRPFRLGTLLRIFAVVAQVDAKLLSSDGETSIDLIESRWP